MTNLIFLILVLVFWVVFYGMFDSHAQNEWKNYGRKSDDYGWTALGCSVIFVFMIYALGSAVLKWIGIL